MVFKFVIKNNLYLCLKLSASAVPYLTEAFINPSKTIAAIVVAFEIIFQKITNRSKL